MVNKPTYLASIGDKKEEFGLLVGYLITIVHVRLKAAAYNI